MSSPEFSVAQRVFRGAAWNYGGVAAAVIGQIAYTAVTARAVSPGDFGSYAAAQALLSIAGYFTLGAIGSAVIRHPSLDRRVVGSAWLLSGVAGLTVAAVVFVLAGPWADLWRSPGADRLLRLWAPGVLLGSLAVVPLSLLLRSLRYRLTALIEKLAVFSGFGVGAVLALRLHNAEALVLGQVTSSAALCGMSVLAARSELAVSLSRAEARRLFSFSAQVSFQNLAHYVNGALPGFSVSRWLGATSLGFYSRGSVLVGLPWNFMIQGIYKTLYPIYPRYREDRAACQRMMVDVTSVTTALSWPLFGALAGLGPLVIEILLGPEWKAVSGVLPALCLSAAVGISYTVFVSMSEAFGFLKQIWILQISWMVVLVSALAVTIYAGGGIETIALVAAFVGIAIHLQQLALIVPTRLIDLASTLRAEGAAALVGGAWYVTTALVTSLTADSSLTLRLVTCGATLAGLTLLTYVALPYLPAGKAFARHEIGLPWRSKRSVPSG